MFPKVVSKVATSADNSGDNMGSKKLSHTFFGTISCKNIFYGWNWDMLTPALTVCGVRLFL